MIFCFNLVIEMLLISSTYQMARGGWDACFNLVIEMLLISSKEQAFNDLITSRFQSRNRDAFDFKSTDAKPLPKVATPVSIS